MAFAPLAVRHGRLVTPDPIATFFTAAVLAASFLVLRRGHTVDYVISGVLVRHAGSSKFHEALVAIVVVAAHIMRTGRGFATDRKSYLAGGVAVATFVVTSPFVVLDSANSGLNSRGRRTSTLVFRAAEMRLRCRSARESFSPSTVLCSCSFPLRSSVPTRGNPGCRVHACVSHFHHLLRRALRSPPIAGASLTCDRDRPWIRGARRLASRLVRR